MSLIDVHSHFLPPWYVEAASAAGIVRPDGIAAWPRWTVEDHLRLMDDQGIDVAVLSISSPGVSFAGQEVADDLARRVNDEAARLCAAYPDRLRFFASLPLPSPDRAVAELVRAFDDLGASGVVLETHVDGHYLADEVHAGIWGELERRGAPAFVHPTSPPGWEAVAGRLPRPAMEFLFDSTRSITGLILDGTFERHPDLDVIVPHCGAMLPLLVDRVEMIAAIGLVDDPPPPGTVGAGFDRLWFDLAGTPMPVHAATLVARAGTERLLYGSDYCFTPPPGVSAQVAALDDGWAAVHPTPWRELTTANARRLLGLDS